MCTRLKLNFYRIYTATAVSFGEQKSSSLAQQRRAHAQFEMPFSVQVSLLDGGITHVRECVWTAWRTPCIYTIDTRTHTHTQTRDNTHTNYVACARHDPIRSGMSHMPVRRRRRLMARMELAGRRVRANTRSRCKSGRGLCCCLTEAAAAAATAAAATRTQWTSQPASVHQ